MQAHLREQDRRPYFQLLSSYIEELLPVGISEGDTSRAYGL